MDEVKTCSRGRTHGSSSSSPAGTLTVGEMTVRALYVAGQSYEVTGEGYGPAGEVRFKVDPEHRFVGFDAYKKLVASDLDIVMLAANPGYRPMHFEAAVKAGAFLREPSA